MLLGILSLSNHFFVYYFSAVAKIMQHRPDVAPLANWLERWISWLPVYEDREESANCYSFIAQILNGQGVSINVYNHGCHKISNFTWLLSLRFALDLN